MLQGLMEEMRRALAPARTRYVVVSTRVQTIAHEVPMLDRVKGGGTKPRVLQRVMDLRNVKPREHRKGKPWRHNETTNLMKRYRVFQVEQEAYDRGG